MNGIKLIAAIGIPLAMQYVGTGLGYWADGGESIHFVTVVVALGVGVYIFQFIEFSNIRMQRILTAIYSAVCLGALFWITLLTACSFGDCI